MSDLSRRSILVGLPILSLVPTGRVPLAAEAVPATGKRLALSGYDPVSYFTDGHPEKGSSNYQASYDDATYWFKTPEHRATFVADPAMRRNSKVFARSPCRAGQSTRLIRRLG